MRSSGMADSGSVAETQTSDRRTYLIPEGSGPTNQTSVEALRPEYSRADFGTLVRGKHVEHLRETSNVVVVDPDMVELSPNAESV